MTLLERVQATEHETSTKKANAHTHSLTELRGDVRRLAAMDELVILFADKPHQARNELKAACRKALATPKWENVSPVEKEELTEQLIDVVFGMGPVDALIEDESITEVMVNGARQVFFERNGILERSEVVFENDEQVRVLIDRIIGPLGRRIDESSPLVNARLPQGHRVHAVIPPITPDGPHLTIRAFGKHSLTLGEMVMAGSLSTGLACYLGWLIRLRKNIVVSGSTGSGKTTMLNALSHLIGSDERVITIEDSAELKLAPHAHVVRMEARPMNAEGTGEVTIRELVLNALRMRPDRIIVGECRGGEAWDMLQAMNTGHDGSLTTLHANAPMDVIDRMVTMVRYAADLPLDAIEAQIGNAFDVIVQVARDRSGHRFVTEVAEVAFDRQQRCSLMERVFWRDSFEEEGVWVKRPAALTELCKVADKDESLAKEVRRWEQTERLPADSGLTKQAVSVEEEHHCVMQEEKDAAISARTHPLAHVQSFEQTCLERQLC